jgi:hypothetical protein
VCGDLCKRRTLPLGPVAYVGDGYSDRCGAALVAVRAFARVGGPQVPVIFTVGNANTSFGDNVSLSNHSYTTPADGSTGSVGDGW